MSFNTIKLRETQAFPHDEEHVYGEDFTLVFQAGDMDDLVTYRTGIVNARIRPKREDSHKAVLNAMWTFPRLSEAHHSLIIESDAPIELPEVELAASGMMTALETRFQSEIKAAHERYRQLALRSEG